MLKYFKYYFGASYRRKILDKLLEQNKHYYKGIVLDIGGRDRGMFKKPKNNVQKWIFVDIEKKHNPDIVLDVANMDKIQDQSIDVVNVLEIFEHAQEPEKGLAECYRVLKNGGKMILSAPFLYPVHQDPFDFQRWTKEKWENEIRKNGFVVEKFEIMGRYFTVMMDMNKALIKQLPLGLTLLLTLFYPLMDLLTRLDGTRYVKSNPRIKDYHQGYFIICKK